VRGGRETVATDKRRVVVRGGRDQLRSNARCTLGCGRRRALGACGARCEGGPARGVRARRATCCGWCFLEYMEGGCGRRTAAAAQDPARGGAAARDGPGARARLCGILWAKPADPS